MESECIYLYVIWGAEVMCYDRIIATYQSCWVGNCVEILLSVCHAFVPHPFYVYVQCSLCTVFYSYTKCCRKLVTKHVLAGFEFIRLQPQTHQICGFCVKQQRKKKQNWFCRIAKHLTFNDVSRQKELTFLHVWNVQRIALFSRSLVCEFHRIRLSLLSVAVVVCRWTHLPQVFGLWCDLFVTMAAHRCFERLENLPVTWAPSEHHSFACIYFMLRTFELNVKNCIWFHSKRCKFEQEAIANVSMILRHSIKFH